MAGIPIVLEGDDLTATNINAVFTALESRFNDIQLADIQRYSLREEHLPSLADGGGLFSTYGATNDPNVPTAGEGYLNTIPQGVGGSNGINQYLQSFHPQIYGPYTTVPPGSHTADEGWLIPSASAGSSTNAMRVPLDAGDDLSGLFGIRVHAWLETRETDDNGNPEGGGSGVPSVNEGEPALYMGFGIEDTSGRKHVIARTIRRWSASAINYGCVSSHDIIQASDIAAAKVVGVFDDDIAAVFTAIITGLWDADKNQHVPTLCYIRNYGMTVEPLRGGTLA